MSLFRVPLRDAHTLHDDDDEDEDGGGGGSEDSTAAVHSHKLSSRERRDNTLGQENWENPPHTGALGLWARVVLLHNYQQAALDDSLLKTGFNSEILSPLLHNISIITLDNPHVKSKQKNSRIFLTNTSIPDAAAAAV